MSCHNLWPVFIRPISAWAWPKVTLVAAGLAFAAPSPTPVKPFTAYHDGDAIVFTPEMTGTRRLATFGPWNIGERLTNGGLVDKRLNLYLVVPGTQYRSPQHPQYDHNRIVNKYTADGKVHDWDIFYCFIIDPKLADDFRSESDLLIAAHQTFRPAGLFELKDIPSGKMMQEKLGVRSLGDVWKYHRKNHSLPRMLIVPAHLAVRGTAELPDVTITHPAALPER
jgi:hypothetical protein